MIIAALVLAVASCETPSAAEESFPIKPAELLGRREGLSDDGIFYIMDLGSNAVATVAYTSRQAAVRVVHARSWQCIHKRFLLAVNESDKNRTALRSSKALMAGCRYVDGLRDTLGNKSNFHRDDEWERLRRIAAKAMQLQPSKV